MAVSLKLISNILLSICCKLVLLEPKWYISSSLKIQQLKLNALSTRYCSPLNYRQGHSLREKTSIAYLPLIHMTRVDPTRMRTFINQAKKLHQSLDSFAYPHEISSFTELAYSYCGITMNSNWLRTGSQQCGFAVRDWRPQSRHYQVMLFLVKYLT